MEQLIKMITLWMFPNKHIKMKTQFIEDLICLAQYHKDKKVSHHLFYGPKFYLFYFKLKKAKIKYLNM